MCVTLSNAARPRADKEAPLQAEKNAKNIVRELEDAKLAGIDYPVSSLINLRQVSPRTCAYWQYSHAVLSHARSCITTAVL